MPVADCPFGQVGDEPHRIGLGRAEGHAVVDTSVWVEHLRSENSTLASELGDGRLLAHPFVIGELAGGTLRNRREALDLLGRLPSVPTATHAEALDVLERRAPMGRGIDRAQRGQRLAGASPSTSARMSTFVAGGNESPVGIRSGRRRRHRCTR